MGKRTPIGISLDSDIILKLDSERGLIPRSRYIEQAIRRDLENC